MDKIKYKVVGLLTLFLLSPVLLACTDFRIIAKDGSVIITRTLEFAMDLNSNLRNVPRASIFNTTAPDNKPGVSWTNKYGYLYLDGLNMPAVVDGMNEKGLSFEYLYLPGETKYQNIPADKSKKALPYYYLGDWVLGNFSTVDEVRTALKNILVFAQKMPQTGNMIFPLHAAIYDASGQSIVVEFVNGEMTVYDNQLGVMTNSPTYDWHLTNLRNYLNLSPYSPNPIVIDNVSFLATGQGAGMTGLPGDSSPPSRFVKSALMLATVLPVNDANAAVNLAQHIINNVDIPKGFVRGKNADAPDSIEYTQWTVFKDLSNKLFYYRTYNDLSLRLIDMNKLDFSENAPVFKMPIFAAPIPRDMTDQFKTAQKKG